MNISINFEGLNKILCKLALHRWSDWNEETRDYKYGLARYCFDCHRSQFKKYS